MLGHLARAGEVESELVSVCGNDTLDILHNAYELNLKQYIRTDLCGDVDAGVVHGPARGVDEGDLVRHRRALLGLPGEVDVINIRGYDLEQGQWVRVCKT